MFHKPKGTVDFFPEEKALQNYIFERFCAVARHYNFKQVESPAFETKELLTKKSGDEILEQIFTLEKRGAEEFGLRFDLTVPLARMFIEKQKETPKPVKWFYRTRMWRYEAPQKGRLREFFQFGAELFGSKSPLADAQIISLVIDCFRSLGLTEKDFFVKLNNRKLLEGLLLQIVTDDKLERVMRIIDKHNKVSEEEFDKELNFLQQKQIASIKEILDLDMKKLETYTMNDLAREGYDELKELIKHANTRYIQVDLSTARGLAYYTGTVFELYDTEQKFRALCGGGRYDDLIELFGGQPTPATGFAIGYSTVCLLLEEKKLLPPIDLGPEYFIAAVNDDVRAEAVKLFNQLKGHYVVEIDLMNRSLRHQFDYASSLGSKNIIIIGPQELKEKAVTIRNMKTGKEEKVKLSQFMKEKN